jgi:hypothetical protein
MKAGVLAPSPPPPGDAQPGGFVRVEDDQAGEVHLIIEGPRASEVNGEC